MPSTLVGMGACGWVRGQVHQIWMEVLCSLQQGDPSAHVPLLGQCSHALQEGRHYMLIQVLSGGVCVELCVLCGSSLSSRGSLAEW